VTTLTSPSLPVDAPPVARARRTPLAARGEPAVWLMGSALVACVAMITGLLAVILVQGLSTFWPRPIELAVLRSGERVLGIPVREEPFDPAPPQREEIEKLRASGSLIAGALAPDGRPIRRQYRVGNRELGHQPFRWVNLFEVGEAPAHPLEALLLERQDWGIWIGTPESVVRVEQGPDGKPARTILAEGPANVIHAMDSLRPEVEHRRDEILRLRRGEIGRVNAEMDAWRQRIREAEIDLADRRERSAGASDHPPDSFVDRAIARACNLASRVGWGASLVLAPASILTTFTLYRRLTRRRVAHSRRLGIRLACAACACLSGVFLLVLILERPRTLIDEPRLQALRATATTEVDRLRARSQDILTRLAALEREDAQVRIVVRDVNGKRFAPVSQTSPDEPLALAQVVRAVSPNQLGFFGKARVYFDRWAEFLGGEPRAANTEGGVFPVVFGTVLLTLLLSITVVPLGVIAALYLREYAKQGLITSAVRIAVNNLAGVPSIVYGVFGLGFFCYTIGPYIDGGPESGTALAAPDWWALVLGAAVVVFGALALGIVSHPRPGQLASTAQVWFKRIAGGLWVAAAGAVVLLFATTPYFQGLFRADLPGSPTFGTRGLLWAALTLALLTLPVVIVATEEAIAAVPRTMREGSFGCGASRWQTIRRIVLPGAMPGIMTGMILAMARGAGEVAPLMIVGAVKKVDELPVSAHFPFIHLDRTFMHLGFHIFDLGFQSPDAEAARPLVWTTTLLLIMIVVLLNLVAIIVRGRLRRRLAGGHF